MSAALLAALLAWAPPARAQEEERAPVIRHLEGVRLGFYLKEVREVYPPLREWPSFKEPGTKLTRYQLERAYAKNFPRQLDTLRLAFKWGQLVRVQAIYSERRSKEEPLEKLVVRYSMRYGEPKRRGMVYSWQDGKTVLRVFNEEISSAGKAAVEMRPCVEIYDQGLRD